jgi:hypothetical protein
MKTPQILVVGETGHGKDAVCKIFKKHFGYRFLPASRYASKEFIFDALREKHGYRSEEQCFNDRRNHIPEWVDLIDKYNTPDPAKLAKEVMQYSDIYCGVRKLREFLGILPLIDIVVYVDAEQRLGKPDISAVEVEKKYADILFTNNKTEADLELRVKTLHRRIVNFLRNDSYVKCIKDAHARLRKELTPKATTKPTVAPKATTKPTVAPKAATKPTVAPKAATKPTVAPKAATKPTVAPKAAVDKLKDNNND